MHPMVGAPAVAPATEQVKIFRPWYGVQLMRLLRPLTTRTFIVKVSDLY